MNPRYSYYRINVDQTSSTVWPRCSYAIIKDNDKQNMCLVVFDEALAADLCALLNRFRDTK